MLQATPATPIYNTDATHPAQRWWESAVIYQIYPRSYQDTNGDGVGDLKGIQQRIPYLKDLGVDAIWISPCYRSPMVDFGYDIADYCDIDPLFGTMADFDALLADAHAAGLRVIMDYVPNHTSDQHAWFLESRSSHENPKRDWYMWEDPKPDGSPPNNLTGFFEGSIWEYDEATAQYYLHMFLKEQPDLNWRNPEVVAAMHNVLRFWLDKGVDGFRLDAITVLVKEETLSDIPEESVGVTGADLLAHLTEIHNHPGLHPVLKGFRSVLNEYSGDRMMIGENYTATFEELIGFYGDQLDEIHLPMNLQTLLLPWDAHTMRASLEEYYAVLPAGAIPSLVFGNHDRSRLASRFGAENHRSAHTLLLTLWGVPTLYYGDELGMVDAAILPEQRQDPFVGEAENVGVGRDPERTPMQWDATESAGFCPSDVMPWLPVNTTFTSNVADQENDPASSLAYNQRLLALRHESAALTVGTLRFIDVDADNLLVYLRESDGERLAVVVNFGADTHTVNLDGLGDHAEVRLSSYMDNPTVSENSITVRPHESIILRV